MQIIILFIVLTIVNIILQTMHSVCLVKCNKYVASVVNAIAFMVYTIVVIYTASDSITLLAKVVITGVCNLIGTYASLTILQKLRKDKVWKIETTFNQDMKLLLELDSCEISKRVESIGNEKVLVVFYCDNQKQTLVAKELINKYNGKYFVSENHTTL